MEFASSILSSILSKIGEHLVDSSIHQANYLFRFKNIVDDLKKEDENLRLIHDRVQQDVVRAKRKTEEIEKDVEKWIMDVHNILEEIQRLEDDMQVKKTFLCGHCPNWGWRYKLSKRAVKKTSVMLKLQESGKFDRVSHTTTLSGVEGPKDFISFKPTEYAFRQIIETLKNDKMNMVGLYGMGGVGKTTLAKVVGKEAREKKLFDGVVMVTVTQNPNVKNIQSQIADLLGLKLEEETEEARAQRLCKRLKNEKKILIILDDVWETLDLTIIGIPFGDDHRGCTILLTTRQQQLIWRSSKTLPSTAFSNLVDLSLDSVGLREICSGGRPPRGFLENLETLKISSCGSMSCLFPSWMLIQSLRKLKKVTVKECGEVEDVFQLEGLCYAKENPFLLSSLESLNLNDLRNLRYIWKGPTQQVSLQSLTVVNVEGCDELRYIFTLSLARSLLQLEQLTVKYCSSLEHIVEIKEAVGGGNDVMFPKLRILQLGGGLQNFINFYSENYSLNMQTAKELNLLRHGLENLEELNIEGYGGVQVLFQLEGVEQELSLSSLKVFKLERLEEFECLSKGPMHLLSLQNLTKLEVTRCNRLRHMFSPSLARNFMQLEELISSYCGGLEQIFIEDDAAKYNQTLLKDHLH
ncbi:hypothetical protein Dsin_022364 [Dipteronia sinensis]|uniref:AAA+ ATPase domain-containing protein n=1 Tax=Dipteronia sinensis TaxID=43782 RepID=A0AAE0A1F2_9ROSI|nr:hypothetical protein Dsin_022364 [Dipteronia sinensis]